MPVPLCEKALRLFARILGAEAGNLALKVLATGGVYLAGGIPPRIVPFFQDEVFLRSFQEKGRMSGLMERIPVHVILDPGRPFWVRPACTGKSGETQMGHSGQRSVTVIRFQGDIRQRCSRLFKLLGSGHGRRVVIVNID